MASLFSPMDSPARLSTMMSSPSENGGSAGQLTPRSKVKAMMAALSEDDSDNERPNAALPTQTSRRPFQSVSGNAQNLSPTKRNQPKVSGSENDDSGDDSPIKPRGRLAAQLKLNDEDLGVEGLSPEVQAEGSAYERIRRRLLGKKLVTNGEESQRTNLLAEPFDMGPDEPQFLSRTSNKREGSTIASRPGTSLRRTQSPSVIATPPMASRSSDEEISGNGSSAEEPEEPQELVSNSRFLELVAKRKAGTEAKEAEEAKRKTDRYAARKEFERILSEDASALSGSSDEDARADKKLTQASRPTRKASKKALEEMNRETQRMNRNMQLAHQAKTKKKISKDSLFARFNFRSAIPAASIPAQAQSSTTASSTPQSDAEDEKSKMSPPTSPLKPEDFKQVLPKSPAQDGHSWPIISESVQEDLPEVGELLGGSFLIRKDKSKTRDPLETGAPEPPRSTSIKDSKPLFTKTRPSDSAAAVVLIDLDSDSESKQPPKRKKKISSTASLKLDKFRALPGSKVKEGRSLTNLRALAHLHSPEGNRKDKKISMNSSDMQALLQRRARQQAIDERKAKIEELKAKGIYVQTIEEREKEQVEVEDMLEKARREAEELKQMERKAKRKEMAANGELDQLEDSSDEDEDYQELEQEVQVELSGSDDEEGDDPSDDDDDEEDDVGSEKDNRDEHAKKDSTMIIDEASESEGEGEGEDEDEGNEKANDGDDETDEVEVLKTRTIRRSKAMVIDDDDEEGEEPDHVRPAGQQPRPAIPTSDPTTRITSSNDAELPRFLGLFGNNGNDSTSLGLTQAFAATMAETQPEDDTCEQGDSMDLLEPPPEPDLPILNPHEVDRMILDSQDGLNMNVTCDDKGLPDSALVSLHFTQSQIQGPSLYDSQFHPNPTQTSDVPDPTQDAGFAYSSPAPERFADIPVSTVDTVQLSESREHESPVKRRGRLRRRENVGCSEDETALVDPETSALPADVFAVMKEQRKKAEAQATFDKKKSEAKGMVEEQAQESEDEYAGLGGASDDESGGEEDEDVQKMMDHGVVNVDESALAALHADKERASDEKAIEKLYKDINNGGLRRKRGAELDLSDSDDDAEARRRQKQREFAKMRKALLADEKVGQIAEDPRKLAFLRAIEDRDEDDDADFLDRPADEAFVIDGSMQDDSNSQSQQPHTNTAESSGRRPPLQETNTSMRPPAVARRTTDVSKKPSTLAEIRDSVSFLIETPGATQALDPSSSASESEDEAPARYHPRRTAANAIIDRLSLKRASSTSSTTTSSTTSTTVTSARLAFYAPGTTSTDGFKVPSLLRRATTQLTGTNGGADANGISHHTGSNIDRRGSTGGSSTSTGSGRSGGGDRDGFGAVKKGGSKKCSVNYFAREMERRSASAVVEQRRAAERERKAKERREGGLGRLVVGGGGFD